MKTPTLLLAMLTLVPFSAWGQDREKAPEVTQEAAQKRAELCREGILPRLSCQEKAPSPSAEQHQARLRKLCAEALVPLVFCAGQPGAGQPGAGQPGAGQPAKRPTEETRRQETQRLCQEGLLPGKSCGAAEPVKAPNPP